jgi:uncharacterized protein with HEPN domain
VDRLTRDADLWITDMARFTAEALALAKGRRRRDLETDRGFELQLTHLVLRIGEAASHVPPEARKGIDLPWRGIVAMRNRLVHAYFEMDHDLLWQTVEDGLPLVANALKAAKRAR